MRIAFVMSSVSRMAGGCFGAVVGMSRGLAQIDSLQVETFGVADEYSADDLPQWRPVPVHQSAAFGPARFRYSPTMWRDIVAGRFDVLDSLSLWGYQAIVVNKVHARKRTPYVLAPHGQLDSWALRRSQWKKQLMLRLYAQKSLEKAACIHALNEAELHSIRQFGLRNPVCVIPNGIELPEIGKRTAESRDTPWHEQIEHKRKVLLYLGRIHPKKGLVNLLRAWAATLNSKPSEINSWCLAIAGWDEVGHEAELKQLASELGLLFSDVRHQKAAVSGQWSVVFLGPQFGEDKKACYRACDAFILPSFSEGLPMTVLEAWAYGKPVVMTPQCNLPEGFVADAAISVDPTKESLEQGLMDLFHAPSSHLQALGNNGRKLVQERFSWPRIAEEMKTVYDWVLGGGSPPACIRMS